MSVICHVYAEGLYVVVWWSPGSDEEELAEDLLKPGHLNRLLDEALGAEVLCLSLPEVSAIMEQLLETVRIYRDSCPPQKLQVQGF